MNKTKTILCIGHASYDITFPLKHFPIENTKNKISKKIECGGGPASNAAYLLGKWKQKVYFSGIVGNDIYGDKIKKELESVKVNIDFVETSKTGKTSQSIVIVNSKKNTRTILTQNNSRMKIKNNNITINPDIILIDGYEFNLSIEVLKNNPNSISIIDAGRVNEEVIELCKHVNYIVCSKEFAEEISQTKIDYNNTDTFTTVFEKLIRMFPNKHYVITLEDKGSIFIDDDDYIKYMPTYRMNVKDTTGAGDVFHGAFAYALANNYTLENAVKLSNISGALSTTKIGARFSVPTLVDVKKLYDK